MKAFWPIGQVPHDGELLTESEIDSHNPQDTVILDEAPAAQVLDGFLGIVTPPQYRREGKGENTHRQYKGADYGNLSEGSLGQCAALRVIDVGVGDDAAYQHQPGERADDHRIPERAGRRYQRLPHGIARLSGGSVNRCRTEPRLVGEEAAGYAIPGSHHDCRPGKTATRRMGN